MLNGHQSILHGFIDQRVHTGDEEVDGTKQRLAVFTQQLLRFCIIPKLILKEKITYVTSRLHATSRGEISCTEPAAPETSGSGR